MKLLGLLGDCAYAAHENGRPCVVVKGTHRMALVTMSRKRTHYLVRCIHTHGDELVATHSRYRVGNEEKLAKLLQNHVQLQGINCVLPKNPI